MDSDNKGLFILVAAILLFCGLMITGALVERSTNLQELKICVENGMQYVEGTCVKGSSDAH